MQLRVDVNNLKSDTLIEILKSFKKTNMIEDFKVVKQNSKEDLSLEDPYFYERQKKLVELREDIQNGKIQLLDEIEANKELKDFL